MISQFHVSHKSLLGITSKGDRSFLKPSLRFFNTLNLSENFVTI